MALADRNKRGGSMIDKSQLVRGVENLKANVKRLWLLLPMLEDQFIKHAEREGELANESKLRLNIDKLQDDFFDSEFHKYKEALAAELRAVVNIAKESFDLELPTCRRMAIAVEGGFLGSDPLPFTNETIAELEQLVTQIQDKNCVESNDVTTDSPRQGKTPIDSQWATARDAFVQQSKGPTEFARSWVTANPRRISKLVEEYGSKEAAIVKLRDVLYKTPKSQ